MQKNSLTIGRLAKRAGVSVETIRYYQTRSLLPTPEPTGAYRYYNEDVVERLHFIKRAQELGFSLNEIQDLLSLSTGIERENIRAIASEKLQQIEEKLGDLQRMKSSLTQLISDCQHTAQNLPCPIVAALSGKQVNR